MNPMSSTEVHVSKHADARMKERLGLPKKARVPAAQKAYDKGKLHHEYVGSMKRFLDKQYLSHGNGNQMRIYNNTLWLFSGITLVTVIPIPNELKGHI